MPWTSKVLLLLAFVCFLIPTIENSYYAQKEHKEFMDYQTRESKTQSHSSDVLLSGDMVLEVPSINLKLPIKYGASHENMLVGVGTMTNEQVIRGKNLTLAGHRFLRRGRGFNRLGDVVEGDIILVKTQDKSVKFVVSEILVVTPDDVSVLDNTGKTEVTLVTCAPIAVSTHRLIIKGEMI